MPSATKKGTRRKKSAPLSPAEQRIADLKATLPPVGDWRTTDAQEIARRQLRALENPPAVRNLFPARRIHSTFELTSPTSDRTYHVEILDLSHHLFYSTSPDFATARLGTCKHTEAVLFHLQQRFPRLYKQAEKTGPTEPVVTVRHDDLAVHCPPGIKIPPKLRRCTDASGTRKPTCPPEKLLAAAGSCGPDHARISAAAHAWLDARRHTAERLQLHREYEQKVHSGEFPAHETRLPLYPYQRAGMLHLAFTGRAMVADEMGLGKTAQAIAAASLLHRLGKASRCLIVCPTSLKAEWEEQISKFTDLTARPVYGNRSARIAEYQDPQGFFTITNYEQVRSDSLDINAALKPDIVILDEAQRIKNWASLTARAIKRLESPYAFVLTGTPIENRIDELYSIVEFLDPTIFGALFRFNRDYYQLDEKGKPEGYRNLDHLRRKVAPIILRRLKAEVETELPDRTDENRFVQLTEGQRSDYAAQQDAVRKLLHIAGKRPLRREEHQRLMSRLGMMRMLCDTQFILDHQTRVSPKLDELKPIFDQAFEDPGTKIIVFSEWVRMLELVRDYLQRRRIGYAWHTGSVPQQKRRAEIRAFKEDPDCRVFLCTESGGAGLNLQNASIVINLDLPWNPAKLEQRIARAWRKGQPRPVQVINIIAEGTIEHGMLQTLAHKKGLADGVLDGVGDLSEIKLKKGGQSFLTRLELTLEAGKKLAATRRQHAAHPADPAAALARALSRDLGPALLHCQQHLTPDSDTDDGKLYIVVDHLDPATTSTVHKAIAKTHPATADDPAWITENLALVDAATHNALRQLQQAGLIQTTARAKRNLLDPAAEPPTPPLTPEQKAQLAALAATRDQHLEAATLLTTNGLHQLAQPHLTDALLACAAAHAIHTRTTPPDTAADLTPSLLPEPLRPLLDSPPTTADATRDALTLIRQHTA